MRIVATLVLIATPLAFAAFAPGCGNSCEDLEDVCDNCTDEDYRQSCLQTVTDNNQELCSQRRALFTQECPEPQTSSSTVGPTGPATSGGGVGGIGGAGGEPGTGAMGGIAGMGGSPNTGGTGGIGGN